MSDDLVLGAVWSLWVGVLTECLTGRSDVRVVLSRTRRCWLPSHRQTLTGGKIYLAVQGPVITTQEYAWWHVLHGVQVMHVWSRPPAIVSVSVSQQDKDETDFFCPETKCGVKTIDRKVQWQKQAGHLGSFIKQISHNFDLSLSSLIKMCGRDGGRPWQCPVCLTGCLSLANKDVCEERNCESLLFVKSTDPQEARPWVREEIMCGEFNEFLTRV